MKYTIRPFQPGDEEAINQGFNEVFGATRSIEEWYWKYGIDSDGSWITVAVDEEGRVVAHYAAIRENLKIRDRIVVAGQGVDAYRAGGSSYQNSFVFSRTANRFFNSFAAQNSIPFVFGFPGEIARKVSRNAPGAALLVKVSLWQKDVRQKWFYSRFSEATTIPPTHEIDSLWAASHTRYPIGIVRNADRFYKRYANRPQRTYHYLTIRKDGILKGVAVFWNSTDALRWVDLLWDGVNSETLQRLESAAVSLARNVRAKRILMWLRGDFLAAEIFRKAGWTELADEGQPYLAAVSWTPEINADDFVQNAYITMGDSDLV